jgi:exopolysaccharide production negative regulator
MPMFRRGVVAALATGFLAIPFAVGGAENTPPFVSATGAYHAGIADLKSGEIGQALPALEYAAERGVLGAQLKLASLYAVGDGVKKDDAKAFYFYQQIANQRADISPVSPVSKYVAESFVALGNYYLKGIPSAGLLRDPSRAANLYRHAASYFGDADAQYALARLYLDGDGVEKNVGLAINWLANAAKKQHAEAQAALGELLWRGGDAVRQRPARALALIMLAHANAKADGNEPKWISDLYLEVEGASTAAMRQEAQSLMPELGGRAVAERTTTAKGNPADELLLPAAGGASPSAPVPAPSTGVMASGLPSPTVAPPEKIGVPVGFSAIGTNPLVKP